jgi:hypothetical protein
MDANIVPVESRMADRRHDHQQRVRSCILEDGKQANEEGEETRGPRDGRTPDGESTKKLPYFSRLG